MHSTTCSVLFIENATARQSPDQACRVLSAQDLSKHHSSNKAVVEIKNLTPLLRTFWSEVCGLAALTDHLHVVAAAEGGVRRMRSGDVPAIGVACLALQVIAWLVATGGGLS